MGGMRIPAAAGLVAAVAVLEGAGGPLAQDRTPAASPADAGTVACTVEPRPVEELVGFYFAEQGTPAATPLPAVPVASEADLPQGEPADAATAAALAATVAEIFVCFDDNQYARAFALMTNEMVRQFGPDPANSEEDTAEEVRALLEGQLAGTPGPVPAAERQPAPVLRDAQVLPDGRAGAVVEEEDETVFLLFEQEEGRWLLAGILPVAPGGTPTP